MGSFVKVDGPHKRETATEPPKAGPDDDSFHRGRRMYERAKVGSGKTTPQILERQPPSHEPAISWIREPQHAARVIGRALQQGDVIRITANHTVHGHDIGRREAVRDGDKITRDATNSVALFSPDSLALGRLQVCG